MHRYLCLHQVPELRRPFMQSNGRRCDRRSGVEDLTLGMAGLVRDNSMAARMGLALFPVEPFGVPLARTERPLP